MRFCLLVLILTCLDSSRVNAAFWDVEPVYINGYASGDASLAVSPGNVISASMRATALSIWQYVAVTGISSCTIQGSGLIRVLRVRSADDVVPVL